MNISEIMLKANTVASFSNLIPLTDIKTEADAEAARKKGYSIYTTVSEFREEHPLINPNHIWFSPNFTSTYYWDNIIVFPISYYINGRFWGPAATSLESHIRQTYAATKLSIDNGDYSAVALALSGYMRMEYLNILADNNIIVPYKAFLQIYSSSDCSCNILNPSTFTSIIASKTDKEKQQTANHLASLPNILTLYRGSTNMNAALSKAFSWTLDKNIALSYAINSGSDHYPNNTLNNNACLYTAHIKKEDIIEYIASEKECLVYPEKIFDVQELPLYGYDWLQKKLTTISPTFEYHRDHNKYRKIHFDMHSRVHGKAHCLRVMLLCLLLAHQYCLDDNDTNILIEAALYHDTGRHNDDDDTQHGARSAAKYQAFVKDADPIVILLITYHCLDDEKGYSAIDNLCASFPELAPDKDRLTLLYNILKDADALDRLRLHPSDLDINYLRTEEARKMPLVAKLLLEDKSLFGN